MCKFALGLDFIGGGRGTTENITITTYYPAPYGVYKEIRADQMSVGSTYRTKTLSDGDLIVEGNVGIGTPAPVAKLDVGNGGIRLSGKIRNGWNYYVRESTAANPTICCDTGDIAVSWSVNDVDVHTQWGNLNDPQCLSFTGYATGSNNKQVLCIDF